MDRLVEEHVEKEALENFRQSLLNNRNLNIPVEDILSILWSDDAEVLQKIFNKCIKEIHAEDIRNNVKMKSLKNAMEGYKLGRQKQNNTSNPLSNNRTGVLPKEQVNIPLFNEFKKETEGIKETEGKLYYELSWEFIEEMAKRMSNNKSDKYPRFNWKKNIDVEDLKQAINRHHIEVMKGNYRDGEELLGHIVSYACNSMMLWEQLKSK